MTSYKKAVQRAMRGVTDSFIHEAISRSYNVILYDVFTDENRLVHNLSSRQVEFVDCSDATTPDDLQERLRRANDPEKTYIFHGLFRIFQKDALARRFLNGVRGTKHIKCLVPQAVWHEEQYNLEGLFLVHVAAPSSKVAYYLAMFLINSSEGEFFREWLAPYLGTCSREDGIPTVVPHTWRKNVQGLYYFHWTDNTRDSMPTLSSALLGKPIPKRINQKPQVKVIVDAVTPFDHDKTFMHTFFIVFARAVELSELDDEITHKALNAAVQEFYSAFQKSLPKRLGQRELTTLKRLQDLANGLGNLTTTALYDVCDREKVDTRQTYQDLVLLNRIGLIHLHMDSDMITLHRAVRKDKA